MAIVYKVWIDIDEYDEDSEDGKLLDSLNIPCTATFDTFEKANRFALEIHEANVDGLRSV